MFRWICDNFRPNVKIGQDLRLYGKLVITGKGKVHIGDRCTVDGIPGDRSQYVTLEAYNADTEISIGDDAGLYAARVSALYSVRIGDHLLMEESGILDTDFHSIDKSRGDPVDEDRATCAVVIGDRVRIGARSFVTKGVQIGDDAVIYPGSIVTRSVKPSGCVAGNPAAPIRKPAQRDSTSET